jgi:flagellin-like protein
MPEGTIIFVMFAFVLTGAVGAAIYCLRLASKYKRIEADMACIYEGTADYRYHL